jgi:peptide/nickel transport system permease protein
VATEPAAEYAFDTAGFETLAEREGTTAIGPYRLGLRRLRRNKVALAFGALFIVLVLTALAAPLWADHVAHTDPYTNHLTSTIKVDGKTKDVVAPNGIPIGPQYFAAGGKYFLGADSNGRDVMVRLLYAGRNSLLIGVSAALLTLILSVVVGLTAGYAGGRTDTVISRIMDLIWAYPVVLLGVALGTALSLGGLKIGPIEIAGDSKLIVILIIGFVYIPYIARPLRGQVLSIREKEFVDAARAQGAGPLRIMFSEILPNLSSTIIVFFPLAVANAIILEAGLSFLGAGVRPPETSWGEMISEGVEKIVTAPHLTIVPGLMLVLTVLALNVFGEGVRDALDPRAKIRQGR